MTLETERDGATLTHGQHLNDTQPDHEMTEEDIGKMCAEVLGRPTRKLKMHKSFVAQGGDSLLAIKLMGHCYEKGYTITISDILQATTIGQLCKRAKRQNTNAQALLTNGTNGANPLNVQVNSTAVRLTAIQQLFVSTGAIRTKLFLLEGGITEDALVAALRVVMNDHPMLRARLAISNGDDHVPHLVTGAQDASFIYETREVATDLEKSKLTLESTLEKLSNLGRKHLLAVVALVNRETRTAAYLGIAAGCSIIDARSWDILLGDLEKALNRNHQDGRHRNSFRELAGCESKATLANNRVDTPINGHAKGHRPSNGAASVRDSKNDGCGGDVNVVHLVLDQATARMLFHDSIHNILSTEPGDFVIAALYLSLRSTGEENNDILSFRTIVDARAKCESDKLSGVIGCFDDLVDLAVQPGKDNDDISLLWRVKDSRVARKIPLTPLEPRARTHALLDLTQLEQRPSQCRGMVAEVQPKQRATQSIIAALPILSLIQLEPFWDEGRLQLRFGAHRDGPFGSSLDLIAHTFNSAIAGLLSRFRTYQPHDRLRHFPILNIAYADLDELVSNQLTRITTDPSRDVEDVFPCSPIQEVFLISQAVHPNLYQCSVTLEVSSAVAGAPLDDARLVTAWMHIVKRHASLRTVFIESGNRPGHFDQVVLKEGIIPMEYLDEGSDTRELSSRRRLTFENYRATHRVAIHKRSEYSAHLRVDISHALADGQSIHALFRDLSQAYLNVESAGAPMPYQDFVSYQQQLSRQDSILYWSEYLAGAQPCLFPASGDRLDRQDMRTLRFHVDVRPEHLQKCCGKFNVTIANICQVAWALVLRSYTGSEDVCFSFVTSGRQAPLKGIESTVGAFIDTMICRVKLSGAMTIESALTRAKNDFVESVSHPCVFAMGHGSRGKDLSPLQGNTIMSCQRSPSGERIASSGLAFEVIDAINPTEYDISLNIGTGTSGLEVLVDFWHSRVNQTTVERASKSFQKALASIVSEDGCLDEMDVVSSEDIEQIRQWNKNIPSTLDRRVHDAVYEQCLRRPGSLAVQGWDGDLTYSDLDQAANKLASYLATLGVKPETMIPLCFEKSKWAVVSQLAVLKAGACVVPIGTKQPMARTELILKDIKANIILTTEKFSSRFKGIIDYVVSVDETALAQFSESEAPPCSATPDNSAFIIYTSGSTGVPKGVVLTHGSLSTSLHHLGAKFNLNPRTRMVQFSAYTFDISIQDIYTTWHYGGCLCIISEEDRINNLGPSLNLYGVNCAGLTSTVAGLISPDDAPTLKTLILLGEAVKPAVVNRWINHVTVFNAYGPSECSIQASCNQLTPKCNALNIGFALAGALWIVDANDYNRLVPIGAPGELLIEGPLQARGYLNDEVKTAAAFITDPAWVSRYGFGSARRFYRTGDLVQQTQDGSILYIGRRDTQIKLRGQRVEVGEIEHHLIQHDFVLDAAIIYPQQGPCQSRLVGLLTLGDFLSGTSLKSDITPVSAGQILPAKLQATEVCNYLTSHVPEHMIPKVWVPLSSMMPQNESGKLDRKKLGQWVEAMDQYLFEAFTSTGDSQAQMRSMTLLERKLRNIWAEVLNISADTIPVEQRSFVSLGGDSITAMQVVSKSRAQGITLLVRDVLQSRSIAQLAHKSDAGFQLVDIAEDLDEPFPLSPIQQWHFESISPSDTVLQCGGDYRYNQSICLASRLPLAHQSVANAVSTIVSKHPMLRSRFSIDAVDGYCQRIVTDVDGSYQFGVHEVDSRDKAETLIEMAQGGLDLKHGPVFSAKLIQLSADGKKQQLLFMTAHHLVVDIMSWRIILRDLDDLLRQKPMSQSKTISFQRWTRYQAEASQMQVAAATAFPENVMPFEIYGMDLDFWGLTTESNLYRDQITEHITLDEYHTTMLFGNANRAMRTEPIEIMLAALFQSFHHVFPDRSVPTVFNEGHGRHSLDSDIDASDTVGWFTTMVPMHIHPAPGGSAMDTLRRTKDTRRRIPGLGLPYFSSRFLTAEGRKSFSSHREMEVLFNYAGRYQQLTQSDSLFDREALVGGRTSPVGDWTRRPSIFGIEVSAPKNILHISFQFNRHMRNQDKVREWVQGYTESLRDLVTALSSAPRSLTLSEFPLAGLTDETLARLQHKILPEAGIIQDNIEDIYPCSPTQQGILMSQIKSPSEYQIQQGFELRNANSSMSVSAEGVVSAWRTVVSRHPMLRTVFVPSVSGMGEGLFDQVVLKSCSVNVEQTLCNDDDIMVHLAIKKVIQIAIGARQPSHQLIVYSTPSDRVYAKITISHALVDASSLILLQRELIQAYDGGLAVDNTGPLYSAYVSYLQRTPAPEALRYWTTLLAEAQVCFLPALRIGECTRSESGNLSERPPLQLVTADISTMKDLQEFSDAHGVTMANVFQLAWALVLSQYTGSTDVSFGYLTSGRDVSVDRVDELVGPLINIMVTRIKVDPKMGVGQALQKVQDDFLDSFHHQRVSLLEIWHALQLTGQGLFNTSLSYRHSNFKEKGKASLAVDVITSEDPTEYDANVNVLTSDAGISVTLQYSPDFMSRDSATRLIGCLLQAVQSLIEEQDLPIGQVKMATKEDVEQLWAWNKSIPTPDGQNCIHDIVRQQQLLRPQSTAVCAWDGNLTYLELDKMADQLAHHLVENFGVGPEIMVAMAFDKSRWATVAQLAVLKAGGVVVSVNPKHPMQRLEIIFGDIEADVMLTTQQYSGRFANIVAHVLRVDSHMFCDLPMQTGPPCQTTRPENAAFIIYTSGSTGEPKGVVLTHFSLLSSFQAHGKVYGMSSLTRSIQFASYTFDASISDTWATICHGGCVCVPSEAERMNGLQAAIQLYQGNLAQLTPTVASLLSLVELPSLRTLVLGGEPVKTAMVEKFLTAAHVRVFNGYGPSECSIYTTCGKPLQDKSQTSNIGRPLAGRVWIADGHERICPIGSVGELWIEGPLLAREYLNDKEKTSKSFVADPRWARDIGLEGGRFYRTGDMVRQSSTGDIIYLGRRDTQIKIRGQRVEIGEIEYQIKKCFPTVRTVAATLVEPGGNTRGPVVAVAMELEDRHQPDASTNSTLLPVSSALRESFSELHSSLSNVLPLYMVPSLFIPVTGLPLTASGKLDRRLLRQVLENLPEDQFFQYTLANYDKVGPSTNTEKGLQSLWAAVLGLDIHRVGINDNFLHSGGDSFTAMRLVSLATSSGISLSVSDVFRYPKLVDMAHSIDSQSSLLGGEMMELPRFALWKDIQNTMDELGIGSSVSEELNQISIQCGVAVGDIEDVYPCTPLQEGLMAITAQRPLAYVGRWAYRMPDTLEPSRFEGAWKSLANSTPILRTRIVPGRLSGALQIVVRGEMKWSTGSDLVQYLQDDAKQTIAYGSPLVRPAIINTTQGQRYFVLTAHHSAYDGWSLAKLFDAVWRLYSSTQIRAPPPFTRFIRYLDQQDPEAAEVFWKSQLNGDITAPFPSLPKPTYQPQPLQTATCRLPFRTINGTLTLATLLRAAWAMVISSHSGGTVLFAVPLSGRAAPVPGILDMLAPTVTTVPVRIFVDDTQPVRAYLDTIQQQAINMIPFEHTGLQHIRRYAGKDINLGHLFAVQPSEELADHNRLGLEPIQISTQGFDGYALTVECITGRGDGKIIEVEARFDENVVSISHADRLLGRFRHIFSQLVRVHNDGRRGIPEYVGDIEMVSPEEVAQLSQWNSQIPEATQALVHELVYQQTCLRPGAPAICSWDGDLSHSELDQLAERLAHHLRSLGVGREVMVPLCFDKSKWAVVSILAVLKAGGAVVPIKADPILRVEAILHDTSAQVILLTPHYASQFVGKLPHVLAVDDVLFSKLPAVSGRMARITLPHNTAFVIYTSGSTGTPKGVVLEHSSMATSMQAHGKKFGMDASTRAFQFASFTFDISLHDMITTIQFGGCVCLPSEEERVNNLAGAIRRMGVNYSFLTPRVLHTLQPSDVPKLQTLIVGGEAVQAEHVEAWARQVRTFNAYGPAECSIISTCSKIVDIARVSTIGHALAGGLWVVDANDYTRLLPIGAVGELLIEGPLLARGYLNNPDKSSSAFIIDPAWVSRYGLDSNSQPSTNIGNSGPKHSRRMYRTGDLVRQNDDGSLVYIGRRDSQVKIRGQRVEIGEIEHHLTQNAAVEDAVVLHPSLGPARSRLVGLLTLRQFTSEIGPDVRPISHNQLSRALAQACSIRQQLLGCVPEYMAPDVWVPLESMPQNASNKVDRRKLMLWLENMDGAFFESITVADVEEVQEAPGNTTQQQLQIVLAEVLHLPLEKVFMSRSFLNMGGDSITAMQVVSRCRTRYGVSVVVRDVLQSSSITQLALKATTESPELQQADELNTPFGLSPIQLLYFEAMAPRGLQSDDENRFNQSVCLATVRRIDSKEFTHATESLVLKHPMLRARFSETEHGWKQRIEPKVHGSFHIGTHHVQSRTESECIIASAQRHLNIEKGPVFSIDLINIGMESKQLLFLTAHHLVVDIVSWRTIARDLDDLILHPATAITSPAISFQTWSKLLAKRSQDLPSPAKVLPLESPIPDWGYWGVTPETNVFGDRTSEQFALGEEDTHFLFDQTQPLRTEPIEVILAALFHSFHFVFPDRPGLTVFNEGHGREPWTDCIDLSDTVGWFTTMTPIHVPVDGDDTIDILRRTKDTRRSIPERGLAYFASRFLTPMGKKAFASHSHAEVTFNYTGRYQQPNDRENLFQVENGMDQPHLSGLGGKVKRLGLFEVEASVWDDKLCVKLHFNRRMQKQNAVRHWVQSYQRSLKELLSRLSTSRPTFTLSDFPSINVTYDELAKLETETLPKAGIENLFNVEDIYPCSPIQQGILLSQIKDQGTYQVQQLCRIQEFQKAGSVSVDKLSRAWDAVVCRHPILRTIFIQSVSSHDLFYQVVLKHWKTRTPIISCARDSDVVTTFSREGRPIYADGQPHHQLTICTTATGQTYAQVDVSHALMDASSLGLVLRDLVQAYGGILPDSRAPSYGSYVSFLQQASALASLDYWTCRLTNAQSCCLPPSATLAEGRRLLKTVAIELNDLHSMHGFRDSYGITVANIVQLAWAVVLGKFTGSKDIIFGYLANGRDAPIPGITEMAGPMINMMVSRIQLDVAGATVAQAAKQVQENFLEAFNNQRTSLGDIQHALHLSQQSLFNTTVSYNRLPTEDLASPASLIIDGVAGEDPTEYDVNVNIASGESTMRLSIQYSSAFLDECSAKSLLTSLQCAICSISSSPEAALEALEIMPLSDIEKLRQWNEIIPTAMHGLVQDRIHQQRLSHPEAAAVCAWDGHLTYSDLDDLTDRLAGHLAKLGICKEAIVGLCFEKSMWTVVAMLAVLKAGGVIVPLGSQLPTQRLRLILDDTQASVVLTSDCHAAKLRAISAATVITIDETFFTRLSPAAYRPAAQTLKATSAAVVIYTSGSTGIPKGVVLTHGALVTSMEMHGAKLKLGVRTRTLQFSAYVFDISLLDIFATLLFGGCVCVVSEEDRMDINNLGLAMETMRVNFGILTPTVARLIKPEAVPTLCTLALAGEALPSDVVETWSSYVDVFNCYGPAECTVLATINGPLADKGQSLNIGKPLAGVVWVADQTDFNCLVPIGVVGELLIEGPLLAREYLHDPEKTAKSFVTDPTFVSKYGFAVDLPRRMYRTGDLVRQNPIDGSIVYIGRADGQVKVRGQRVEVGEIEYCAKKNFSRAQAVAADLISSRQGDGDAVLALAMELRFEGRDHPPAASEVPILPLTASLHEWFLELQAVLTAELPSFMIPAIYVPLRQMPLTDSGKVDRRSLRELMDNLDEEQLFQYSLAGTTHSVSSTPTEHQLEELWATALGTSRQLGAHAHFFRSGGDSVTAMRLVALARNAEPPLLLTVAEVFKNPILESMARAVDEKLTMTSRTATEDDTDDAPFSLWPDVINPCSQDLTDLATQCNEAPEVIINAYPSTPLQQGLLAATARQEGAYVNRWVFRVADDIDIDRFKSAWQQVFELAPALRTRIIADRKSGALQVVIREQINWLVVLSNLESYVAKDSAQLMGFGTPLVRFAIVTDASNRFFVWTAHHSVYDGWAAGKLMDAVSRFYSNRPAPTFVPYTRFIRYLQETKSTSETEHYWRSQLQGSLEIIFPSVPQHHRPGHSRVLTRSINASCLAGAITIATLLRATWALIVSGETGCSDVLFASPLSGRTAPVAGILDIVGPTITTVPIRIRLDETQKLAEYLIMVQQQAIDMIPFEHTGLQNIRHIVPDMPAALQHLFIVQPSVDRMDDVGKTFPGLESVPLEAPEFHNYPLVIECNTDVDNRNNIIELVARFDQAALPAERMQQILERFECVFSQLQSAAASNTEMSDGLVGDVNIVSPGDISKIRTWNRCGQSISRVEACVHDLVYQQQLSQPDAQAVCAWDGNLSHGELDTLASRLAHHLVSLGVGPETAVALLFEKSQWAVVAQLAVLKAGGTVVSVNYQHPTRRIRGILQVTATKVMLTSQNNCYSGLVPHVLVVDQTLLAQLPTKDGPACTSIRPTNSAFIIFTSGSTGTPKGVVLEHSAVATSLLAHAPQWSGRDTRALQFGAYTFDVSITEIFATLILGGCVCVISEQDRIGNLSVAMEAIGVNFAYLTPTVAGFLKPQDVPTLEKLVCIGEPLKSEVAAGWIGSHTQIYNAYGPTECSILSTTSCPITDVNEAPNIGAALPCVNAWVVNQSDYHLLLPVGNVGELLLEGPLLARGYLGDDEKTAEAFVTDPAWLQRFDLGSSSGRRFYRTGDLVQQNPDGSFVCLGRRDTQVKINGQRVEIGEIECCVKNNLPGVGEAVAGFVTTKASESNTDTPNTTLAVAIEIPTPGQADKLPPGKTTPVLLVMSDNLQQSLTRLRNTLIDALPTYMVPQLYLPVAKLPLTDSGKLDRRVVEAIIQQSTSLSPYFLMDLTKVPPSTDTERHLQKLWAVVLNVPVTSIGARDNFFSSGGDSISAMRLAAKAKADGRLLLSVQDVFRYPVLCNLAASISQKEERTSLDANYARFSTLGVPNPAVFIQSLGTLLSPPGVIVDAGPTTDFQAHSVVASLRSSRDLLAHISIDGNGTCDIPRWRASCLRLVECHEILRTAYVFHKRQLFQLVLQQYKPDVAHFETAPGQTIQQLSAQLIAEDMHRPPRLGRPFLEFAIITSGADLQHRILFRLSHGEYDAISISYFVNSLKTIHDREPVPEYPSFLRYMYSLSNQNKEQSRQYWRTKLQGSSMSQIVPDLGAQDQHHSKLIYHATRKIDLTKPLPTGMTVSTVVRAAWSQVLALHTGSRDVLFGEVVSGRSTEDPITERTAGCCANIVPVRATFEDFWTISSLFRHLHEDRITRLPHETVGFREILRTCTDMPRSTYFTSQLNHLNQAPRWTLDVGTVEYDVSVAFPIGARDVSHISIASFSRAGSVEIHFGYLDKVVSPQLADELLDRFCGILDLFVNGSHRIPLNSVLAKAGLQPKIITQEATANNARSLNSESHESDDETLDLAFEGDLVDAGWIAFEHQQEGREVSIDSVLRRPRDC